MNALLPLELTQGAILRDKEYAWELSAGRFGASEVDRANEFHGLSNAYFITEQEFLLLR